MDAANTSVSLTVNSFGISSAQVCSACGSTGALAVSMTISPAMGGTDQLQVEVTYSTPQNLNGKQIQAYVYVDNSLITGGNSAEIFDQSGTGGSAVTEYEGTSIQGGQWIALPALVCGTGGTHSTGAVIAGQINQLGIKFGNIAVGATGNIYVDAVTISAAPPTSTPTNTPTPTSTPTVTYTPTQTFTPMPTATCITGKFSPFFYASNSNQYCGNADYLGTEYIYTSPATILEGGAVTAMGVSVDCTFDNSYADLKNLAPNMNLAIYSDGAGAPGTLLTQTGCFSVPVSTTGWITVGVSSPIPVTLSAGAYWFAGSTNACNIMADMIEENKGVNYYIPFIPCQTYPTSLSQSTSFGSSGMGAICVQAYYTCAN